MDAALGAQPAVGAPPVDRDGHALEAGLLAFLLVEDLGREAVPLGPAQVHPQEHLGPVGGLGAAGAGADRQERRALVVLAGEEQGRPLAREVGLERRGVAFELGLELGVGGLVQELDRGEQVVGPGQRARPRSSISPRRPSASRRTFWAARPSSQNPGSWVSASSSATRASLASRSKMPRGRPDPFSQVADGGRVHLVPDLQILEQDRAQLDEAQGGLASGDDGVHARAVAVVRADAAVAVAVEGCGVAARPAVTLAGDQIDERCFLGLLHGLPFSVAGQGANGTGADGVAGPGGPRIDGFWHSIRGQSPSAKREIGSVSESAVWGNGQDALPIRKYWASAPSSWSVASIWPARIALDRARRGSASPRP